jgi:hypothetical protein
MISKRGISLIELMISLFAASLIMMLIMQQYLVSKRQYLQIRTQLTKNIELELLSDLIRDSLRRGGFTPCGGISSLQSLDRRNGKTGLVAVEVSADQKSLQINRMNEHLTTVLRQLSPRELLVGRAIPFKKKQTVMIADCYHAEVQRILELRKTTAGTILTFKKALAFHFIAPVYLSEWIEERFFIQKNFQGVPSLFYKQNHSEELSPLIKSLAINLNFSPEKNLVELTLGLEPSQHFIIKSEVRAG